VDGGATFNRVDIRTHVDHHALWIDHRDSDHILLGNDGGFYVTYDRMANFEFVSKLPISQFYHVGIDHRRLYNVYGGVQDNGTWGAPSMKLTGQGPDNADWMYLSGGDGFVAFADPNDHNVVYSESQNGSMRWRNLVTGESRTIRPTGLPEDGPGNSFNWKTPMLLSHHNSRIFYTAGRYVFRSLNRGEDLRPISPPINVERQGSGSAVAESPRNPEILYAGTTDGALWVTRNGGAEWTRIDENVGLPGMRWVSSIEASRFAEGRVYVAFDGHRSNDDGPHVYASEDFGATWRPLNANLPANGSTRTLREDLQNPNLLFVGTEFAAFASIDRGQSWTRINNNLPSVAVHEWALHPTSGELIAGTHGRSFWILDIGALRQMSAETVAAGAKLYTPHPAVQWGSRVRAGDNYGNGRFIGENPPAGSIVYYSLAQPADAVALEVLGIDGSTLASLNARNTAGLHRVVWNMRRSGGGPGLEEFEEVGFDDDFEAELQEQQQRGAGERGQRAAGQRRGGRGERGGRGGQARGGRGGRGGGGGGGAPVAPGTYRLRLTVDGQEQNTELVILPDPGDN
jgi:hypothetical protein